MITPKEASRRGRIGAYRLHATHDSRKTTEKARAAFLETFLDEVDPDRILSEPERQRRATFAKKAYFSKLALRSAAVRAKRSRQHPPRSPP